MSKAKEKLLTRRRCVMTVFVYLVFAVVVLGGAPLIGSEALDYRQIISDLRGTVSWSIDTHIFVYQRLPRVLLGFLVGGALALVGSVLQVILRNPLAAPHILGITGGGTVGAVLAISVPGLAVSWGPFSSVQLFALLGAGLTMLMIYLIAKRPQGVSMNTLLLAGVTIGILCGALILLIKYLANPHLLVAMDRWMMGGLDVVNYREVTALLPLLAPGAALLFMQMANYNHLSLGEEMALGHGIDVAAVQRISFIASGLVTAGAVSMAGPIGFVGLVVPHVIRRISGYDHRILLPSCFLAGGGFLVACDTIARTVVAPTEMPAGIITALVGGPFFVYLLLKKR